ncbi:MULTISPECIES: DEAD/DEAH box helicase family protein [unclassified Streptomyces]|uniref:DEAD/DEAH box helicase family protein n=1 Tax=unclassified Streptomyces TaxID=2593676 RepID=UPI00382BBFB7
MPAARRGGLLGRLRRDGPSEVEQLREWISATQGADALEVARLIQRTRDEAEGIRAQASEEADAILRDARDVVKDIKAESRRMAQETERARKDTERHRTEVMACGTGKTFTSLKIAERPQNERAQAGQGEHTTVLFLVPSIALLSQTLREWAQPSAPRPAPFSR